MHTRLQAAVTFVWAHYLRHGGSGQKLCKNKFATVYCRLSQSLKNVFRMVSMWPIQIKGSVSNSWETVNSFMTLWKFCTQGFLGNCQKKSTTTIYSEKPTKYQTLSGLCKYPLSTIIPFVFSPHHCSSKHRFVKNVWLRWDLDLFFSSYTSLIIFSTWQTFESSFRIVCDGEQEELELEEELELKEEEEEEELEMEEQ